MFRLKILYSNQNSVLNEFNYCYIASCNDSMLFLIAYLESDTPFGNISNYLVKN